MFGSLTEKFQKLVASLSKGKLSDANIAAAAEEARLALLEADVNYSVAVNFVKKVKEKALGSSMLKGVRPGEQFLKIVHDELVSLMGTEEASCNVKGKPAVMLLCGLQGSGKTTVCSKLGYFFGKKGKKVLLAALDRQRLAAIEQLEQMGAKSGSAVFTLKEESDPIVVAKKAKEKAKNEGFDLLICDTAGRLHVDTNLMDELIALKKELEPSEILFVANATIGQEAVKVAQEFDKSVNISGSILTMLDGNARAGAAISIKEVTGKPIKFEGVGEKVSDLRIFNPHSMADRILGMGDVINLVRTAQENVNAEERQKVEQKLRTATFSYTDYLEQMRKIKNMGSLGGLLKMLPGASGMADLDMADDEFKKMEAIILSMTSKERDESHELIHGRRKRIALGSGMPLEEVNRMVKGFQNAKKMFKDFSKMKDIKSKIGGNLWH